MKNIKFKHILLDIAKSIVLLLLSFFCVTQISLPQNSFLQFVPLFEPVNNSLVRSPDKIVCPNSIYIKAGEKKKITPNFVGSGEVSKLVDFELLDEKYIFDVSMDSDFNVVIIAFTEGEANLKIFSALNNSVSSIINIHVLKNDDINLITRTAIRASTETELLVNESGNLLINSLPYYVTRRFSFFSSDNDVISVSDSGQYIAKTIGMSNLIVLDEKGDTIYSESFNVVSTKTNSQSTDTLREQPTVECGKIYDLFSLLSAQPTGSFVVKVENIDGKAIVVNNYMIPKQWGTIKLITYCNDSVFAEQLINIKNATLLPSLSQKEVIPYYTYGSPKQISYVIKNKAEYNQIFKINVLYSIEQAEQDDLFEYYFMIDILSENAFADRYGQIYSINGENVSAKVSFFTEDETIDKNITIDFYTKYDSDFFNRHFLSLLLFALFNSAFLFLIGFLTTIFLRTRMLIIIVSALLAVSIVVVSIIFSTFSFGTFLLNVVSYFLGTILNRTINKLNYIFSGWQKYEINV